MLELGIDIAGLAGLAGLWVPRWGLPLWFRGNEVEEASEIYASAVVTR